MLFIVGPTSCGKTSLALEICSKIGGEIISADSRQVYKNFDVGTGKLPVNLKNISIRKEDNHWSINNVRVWMYDVASPSQNYSVFDYFNDACSCIANVKKYHHTPIVVGGTGFYIDALLGKTSDQSIEPDWEFRKMLDSLTVSELQSRLPEKILSKMNKSDFQNPHRLIRKIELLEVYGISELKSKDYEIEGHTVVYLTRARESLYARADQWADEIWPHLINETKMHLDFGFKNSAPMTGLIYKTAVDYTESKVSESEALRRIKFDLHAYIRRQETWFKKYSAFCVKLDADDNNAVKKFVERIVSVKTPQ